jgi:hypothetical protein
MTTFVVALTALASAYGAAPVLAGTYTWAEPGNFTVTAPGANPDHDAYGATPWSYREGPVPLTTLKTFGSGLAGGLAGWTDASDPNAVIGVPTGGTFTNGNGVTFATGQVGMSPSSRGVALGWTSPFGAPATVTFTGTIVSMATNLLCGLNPATTWALVQGSTTLTSGTVGTSASSFSQTVSVAAGARVDLEVATSSFSAACSPVDATMNAQASTSAKPTVTLTSPGQNALYPGIQPTFAGAASTAFGTASLVTVRVYAGNAASGTPVQTLTTTASGGAYAVGPSSALANGVYTAVAEQDDLSTPADQGLSAPVSFVITTAPGGGGGGGGGTTGPTGSTGTTGPSGTVLTLNAPAGNIETSSTPTFTGTAGTGSAGVKINLLVYPGTSTTGTLKQVVIGAVASDGSFSLQVQSALADGLYTVVASENTGAGAVFSKPVPVLVKANAPGLTLISPLNGQTDPRQPLFYGLAGNEIGDLGAVRLTLYSGSNPTGTPLGTATVQRSGGSWLKQWPSKLALGLYTVVAQQADIAGRVTATKPAMFLVVPNPPIVGSTITITQNGASSVPIYCPAKNGQHCVGTVKILTAGRFGARHSQLTLMSVPVSIYGTTTLVARGRESRTAQQVLAHSRSVAVRVTARLSIAGGSIKSYSRSGRASIAH